MKEIERAFADGEIIFREGEPSRSAFVLTRGRVELVKLTDKAATRVALLRPGDMFGELGLLDESPRATTARSVGPALVKEIPRQEFLEASAEKPRPKIALPSLGALMDRLRGAAAPGEAPAPAHPKSSPPGIVDRLLGAGFSSRPEPVAVMVAPLANDPGGVGTRSLASALNRRHGLKVRVASGLPALAGTADPPPAMVGAIRKWLGQSGAEALIWGEVADAGQSLALRFLPAPAEDEDRPGYFGLGATLVLPQPLAPETADIVAAATLAVAVVGSEPKEQKRHPELAQALAAGLVHGEGCLPQLGTDARARLAAILGHLASAAARWGRGAELHERAARHYEAAAAALKEGLERARIERNLGAARQAIAELGVADAAILEKCAESYRRSLKVLSRAKTPKEWASAQNRLGQVLYRLSLVQGGTAAVKESITAFQSALAVYGRAEYPARWAEIMHDLARAAQFLGGELRSVEALEKAVEACRGALEIRTREAAPLLWAATQNNLGSALFLLGKIAKAPRHVEAAALAFREAASLGPIAGAKKIVATAEKNLAHVERYLAELSPRRPAKPGAAASETG